MSEQHPARYPAVRPLCFKDYQCGNAHLAHMRGCYKCKWLNPCLDGAGKRGDAA